LFISYPFIYYVDLHLKPHFPDGNRKYGLPLCVVGAGMGGLGCALALLCWPSRVSKHISIYETTLNLGFVRADIQPAYNLARILERLGYRADISPEAVELKEFSIRYGIGFYLPQ
jgi:salicylate hydroxylase